MSTYLVCIVPSSGSSRSGRNYRIFQHASIPDIVGKLLAEWRIEHAFLDRRGRLPPLRVPRAVRGVGLRRS